MHGNHAWAGVEGHLAFAKGTIDTEGLPEFTPPRPLEVEYRDVG